MKDKLKPCPFCGGEAVLLLQCRNSIPSGEAVTEAVIKCNKCNVKFTRWALKKIWAKKSVIEAWNQRAEKTIDLNPNHYKYLPIYSEACRMSELKPCPSCGGLEARKYEGRIFNVSLCFNIVCTKCGYSTDWKRNEKDAVDAWNRRDEK